MKKNSHVRFVSRECNIRNYRYSAHVDKRTGRVLKITAGCRTWRTFAAAFAHYEHGKGAFGASRWEWSVLNAMQAKGEWASYRMRYADRQEAIRLLHKLRADVIKVQLRIRRKAAR